MTNAWRLLGLTICVGGLAGASAFAASGDQAAAGREPFTLGVSVRGDYTDNRDAVENNKESTFDFYVTPRIDVYLQSERTLFNVFYAPSYRYRTDPSPVQNDSDLLHDFGLSIDQRMSDRTQLRLREKLDYQDDPAVDFQGSPVRDNRSYLLNRVEGGVAQDLSPLTKADVLVRNTMKRYDDSKVAEESDEDHNEAQLLLFHQLSPTLGSRGTLGYSMYGYDSAIGLQRDFDALLTAVGLEKVFSPAFRGGIEGGAQFAQYQDDTIDSEVFPYGKLNTLISPTPSFRVNGQLMHGVRESDVYPFASQEYTELRGGVEVDPSPALTLGLDGTVRNSEYSDKQLPSGSVGAAAPLASSGNEDTVGVAGSAAWKIRETARLTFRQLFENVDSDVAGSFTKNTSSLEFHLDI